MTITLPIELDDGLLLRWGKPEDADALANFNVHVHSDNPEELNHWIAHWTKDLMSGKHPTTSASDFTVVVDTTTGEIVSSLVLISQKWMYEDVVFGVGRPEIVGTHPDYRRRGLVRLQMEAVHAKSAARGEMVQGITGIPWYYRKFGYEMGLNLGGYRVYPLPHTPGKKQDAVEPAYAMREATLADLPVLKTLYARFCEGSLVSAVRDDAIWHYELTEMHPDTIFKPHLFLIFEGDTAVAYADLSRYKATLSIRQIATIPGHSLRAVALFVLEQLKEKAFAINASDDPHPIERINFYLSEEHPVYHALERELRIAFHPYAWYVRVPDLPAFLRHIAPVLERRLANSVMAGHSGTLRLNFYTSHLTLVFERGKLVEVGRYEPKSMDEGDGRFPDLTFLQLLFGYRSLDELDHARADCYVNNEAAVLLKILFPKKPSWIEGIG